MFSFSLFQAKPQKQLCAHEKRTEAVKDITNWLNRTCEQTYRLLQSKGDDAKHKYEILSTIHNKIHAEVQKFIKNDAIADNENEFNQHLYLLYSNIKSILENEMQQQVINVLSKERHYNKGYYQVGTAVSLAIIIGIYGEMIIPAIISYTASFYAKQQLVTLAAETTLTAAEATPILVDIIASLKGAEMAALFVKAVTPIASGAGAVIKFICDYEPFGTTSMNLMNELKTMVLGKLKGLEIILAKDKARQAPPIARSREGR